MGISLDFKILLRNWREHPSKDKNYITNGHPSLTLLFLGTMLEIELKSRIFESLFKAI